MRRNSSAVASAPSICTAHATPATPDTSAERRAPCPMPPPSLQWRSTWCLATSALTGKSVSRSPDMTTSVRAVSLSDTARSASAVPWLSLALMICRAHGIRIDTIMLRISSGAAVEHLVCAALRREGRRARTSSCMRLCCGHSLVAQSWMALAASSPITTCACEHEVVVCWAALGADPAPRTPGGTMAAPRCSHGARAHHEDFGQPRVLQRLERVREQRLVGDGHERLDAARGERVQPAVISASQHDGVVRQCARHLSVFSQLARRTVVGAAPGAHAAWVQVRQLGVRSNRSIETISGVLFPGPSKVGRPPR